MGDSKHNWWIFLHTERGWHLEGDCYTFEASTIEALEAAKNYKVDYNDDITRVKLFCPETGEMAEGTLVTEEPYMEWD